MITKLKKILPFILAFNFMIAFNIVLLDNARAQIRKSIQDNMNRSAVLASNEEAKKHDQIQ
jgi:hypothetical protein